jgi:hypothetical protein
MNVYAEVSRTRQEVCRTGPVRPFANLEVFLEERLCFGVFLLGLPGKSENVAHPPGITREFRDSPRLLETNRGLSLEL